MQIANEAPTSFRSSAVRPGALELVRTALAEILSRRRLISYLVRAQIKKQGTDTVLGNVWWILDPLLSMLIYVFVMTLIFARKTPDFPLFLLAAMIPFKWFTGTIESSVGAVIGKGALIKQIQFPKIVLPLTICGAEIVNLGFGMVVLVGRDGDRLHLAPVGHDRVGTRHRGRAVRLHAGDRADRLGHHGVLPRHRPSHRAPDAVALLHCPDPVGLRRTPGPRH